VQHAALGVFDAGDDKRRGTLPCEANTPKAAAISSGDTSLLPSASEGKGRSSDTMPQRCAKAAISSDWSIR
jgi:hypothetical protein